jgi:hypothetical protein
VKPIKQTIDKATGDKKVNGKALKGQVHIKKIVVNDRGGLDKVILSDGQQLTGIVQGAFQQNGAMDQGTGEKFDVTQLTFVGKFEVEKPKIEVPKIPILGPNGRPIQ